MVAKIPKTTLAASSLSFTVANGIIEDPHTLRKNLRLRSHIVVIYGHVRLGLPHFRCRTWAELLYKLPHTSTLQGLLTLALHKQITFTWEAVPLRSC